MSTTQTSAGKQMHPICQQEGGVGNTTQNNLHGLPGVEANTLDVDWAPAHGDCRAASNSAQGDMQVTCAGEQTHTHLSQLTQLPLLLGDISSKSTRDKTLDHIEITNIPDPHRSNNFADITPPDSEHGPLLGAPGPDEDNPPLR